MNFGPEFGPIDTTDMLVLGLLDSDEKKGKGGKGPSGGDWVLLILGLVIGLILAVVLTS